ncbi:MAG: ArsB/NhaD family transporter [Chloroflexi bacterium]|nr:ArsB/NhaD family transporter [Chloroflexota bacterium]
MNKKMIWHSRLSLILLLIIIGAAFSAQTSQAAQTEPGQALFLISGQLVDNLEQPIAAAEVKLQAEGEGEPLAEGESQENGSWTLKLTEPPPETAVLHIERAHFQTFEVPLDTAVLDIFQDSESGTYNIGLLALERRVTIGFWAATVIFLGVLLVIALEKLHSTTAALAGLSLVMVITFIGQAFSPDWYILDFERALTYINWEVIFLVMAMMIVVAIIEETGIFQWMAFQAYRLSRGRSWLLVLILMLVTAVASALLDNFTTMLLMTPISLQIGIALGINPLALIIPEVLASNVGGISTLIGTPTNILIGAYADIGFSDFLANQTVGVVIALAVMGGYVLFHYRRDLFKEGSGISSALYARLEENARIEDTAVLWKSGLVFILTLVGFVLGERYHVVPAVPAIIGATALLIWLKPDIHHMIKAVDWTTLVFFMALFMVVGAVQEVGLISIIAKAVSGVVGQSMPLAVFIIVFGVGTLSVAIANIPLAASMLPVVELLSGSIPGASNKALYYALSMGAAMGGNGFLVGAEANLVTAGITAQAGSPISFKEFMKVGLPVTYLTLLVGYIWLAIRFAIF